MKEKTSFAIVFGESPAARIIDFFIDNQEFDYCLMDVSKGAEVSWITVRRLWPRLVKLGILAKTRKIGRAVLYKLNISSPIVRKMIEMDMVVSKQLAKKEIDAQKITA